MTEEHSATKKKHHHRHSSPKKTIEFNGEMVRNPEYTKWKESQKHKAEAHPPNDSEVAKSPEEATGIPMLAVTSIADIEADPEQDPAPTESKVMTAVSTKTYTVPPPKQPELYRPRSFQNTRLGSQPAHTTCPSCHREITTSVSEGIDCGTITAVVLLVLFFWPLFWIPLIMPDCKEAKHVCLLCGATVGTTPSSCSC